LTSAIGCHVDEPEVRELDQLKEYAAIVQLGSVLRNDQSNGESVEKMTAGELTAVMHAQPVGLMRLRTAHGTDSETSVRRQLGRAARAVGGSGAQIGMGTGTATVVRTCVARRN